MVLGAGTEEGHRGEGRPSRSPSFPTCLPRRLQVSPIPSEPQGSVSSERLESRLGMSGRLPSSRPRPENRLESRTDKD